MLSKFFTRKPQRGKPLALRGMAAGLAGMDNAWATLSVIGGSIQWSSGVPTIVIDSTGGGWVSGGDSTTNYGTHIGSSLGVNAILLTNRSLVGGSWDVTDETSGALESGALEVAGGIYAARGLYVRQGVGADYVATFESDFSGNVWIAGDTWGVDSALAIRTGESYHIGDNQVVGAQLPAVTIPGGGSTVDAEARTAISDIIGRLHDHGLIA